MRPQQSRVPESPGWPNLPELSRGILWGEQDRLKKSIEWKVLLRPTDYGLASNGFEVRKRKPLEILSPLRILRRLQWPFPIVIKIVFIKILILFSNSIQCWVAPVLSGTFKVTDSSGKSNHRSMSGEMKTHWSLSKHNLRYLKSILKLYVLDIFWYENRRAVKDIRLKPIWIYRFRSNVRVFSELSTSVKTSISTKRFQ